MRIAISCHPTQGGSGIVATELAHALAVRGHDVHLLSCDPPYRLAADSGVTYRKVNVVDYPLFRYPPHDLCLANELVELVMDHDIDVIHAHYAVPHAVSAILAADVLKPINVKVITTLHGTDITLVGSHRDFYRVCRYAMLRSDAVTAVSQWLRQETVRAFDLDHDTAVQVIPNFVDTGRFTPIGRVDYPADGEFQLLHASNFRPVKRVTDIVRVFDLVRRSLPAHLTLVGQGPDMGLARELCAELDLCDHVTFAGSRSDIEVLYRASHLFMLLSDYESFGLSALEAMACGVPVAASKAGGLVEVVRHNETGLLCPVGDASCIARNIVELLGDRDRWQRTSEAAAHHAANTFATDTVVPAYERLYERLCKPAG